MTIYQDIVNKLKNGWHIQEYKWDETMKKTYRLEKIITKKESRISYQINSSIVEKLVKEEKTKLIKATIISVALNFTPKDPPLNCVII